MPKKKSKKKKQKVAGRGIAKLMREWKAKGTMTTSRATYHPKTKEAAMAQAARIEYEKHGLATR